MISLVVWRARIGLFTNRGKNKNRFKKGNQKNEIANKYVLVNLTELLCDLYFHFLLISILSFFVIICKLLQPCYCKEDYYCIDVFSSEKFQNPFIRFLLIIGGIEQNPGPPKKSMDYRLKDLFEDYPSDEDEMDVDSSDEDDTTTLYSRKRKHDAEEDEVSVSKQMKIDQEIDENAFATNVLLLPVSIRIKTFKLYKPDRKQEICKMLLKYVSILRNSGGGLLRIENEDYCENTTANYKDHDDFETYLEGKDQLGGFDLGHDQYSDLFDLIPVKDGKYFLLFVHGSPHLVTLNFRSKGYGEKRTVELKRETAIKLLKVKKPSRYRQNFIKRLVYPITYNDAYDDGESHTLQFKACNGKTSITTLKNGFDKKSFLIEPIVYFSKNTEGGTIVYGVDETKEKVYVTTGINIPLNKADEEMVITHCKNRIKNHTFWLAHNGKRLQPDKIDEYLQFNFHPVINAPTKNTELLEVIVARFHGIVFDCSEGPEAWKINQTTNEIERICTLNWYRHITNGIVEYDDSLAHKFLELKTPSASPEKKRVFQFQNSLLRIQAKVFERKVNLSFLPPLLFEKLMREINNFATVKEKIQKFYENETGAVVGDKRFLSTINKRMDSTETCKDCHICDFLIVCNNRPVVFLVLTDITSGHDNCLKCLKQYAYMTAKQIKLTLAIYTNVKFGICFGNIDIQRIDEMEETFQGILQQSDLYPASYKNTKRLQIASIFTAFASATSVIPSNFQSSVGRSFFFLLTENQQSIIWRYYHSPRIVSVKGPPGTGKTNILQVVINKLIREGEDKNGILFVAENVPLCEQIRKTFGVVTLTHHELIKEWKNDSKNLLASDIKHILVDDAQFMDGQTTDVASGRKEYLWFHILKNIYEKGEGKFFVFFGEHKYRDTKAKFNELVNLDEIISLDQILRNSRSIAKYASDYTPTNSYYQIAVNDMEHNFKGDKVSTKFYPLDSNEEIICAIDHELFVFYEKNLNFGDIAVLFLSEDEIPDSLNCILSKRKSQGPLKYVLDASTKTYKFEKCGSVKICAATDNDLDDHLVIDSVEHYSSLDRPVVIAVGIEPNAKKCRNRLVTHMCLTRPLTNLTLICEKQQ